MQTYWKGTIEGRTGKRWDNSFPGFRQKEDFFRLMQFFLAVSVPTLLSCSLFLCNFYLHPFFIIFKDTDLQYPEINPSDSHKLRMPQVIMRGTYLIKHRNIHGGDSRI